MNIRDTHTNMTHDSLDFAGTTDLAAERAATYLIRMFTDTDKAPVLVHSGMSGVVAANLISANLRRLAPELAHGLMYIRKEHEVTDCHGRPVEYRLPSPIGGFDGATRDEVVEKTKAWGRTHLVPIFVDRFICSGDTVRRCMAGARTIIDWPDGAWLCFTRSWVFSDYVEKGYGNPFKKCQSWHDVLNPTDPERYSPDNETTEELPLPGPSVGAATCSTHHLEVSNGVKSL